MSTVLIIKRITIRQSSEFVSDEHSEKLCDVASNALDNLDFEGIIKSQLKTDDAAQISVEVGE